MQWDTGMQDRSLWFVLYNEMKRRGLRWVGLVSGIAGKRKGDARALQGACPR